MSLYTTQDTFSRQAEGQHLPDDDLLVLQQYLKRLRVWPEAGDAFLELLPQLNERTGLLSHSDYEWIPQVTQDCICGVDIGSRYPAFFQKLLISPGLRKAFLKTLKNRIQ